MSVTKLQGMVVPLLTPFQKDESLDEQALRKQVNRLIDSGVHGVFPVGSSGEFWALSRDERNEIVEIVVDEAAGRVPVYAGTGAISTREAVVMTRRAEALGADAVVVITPFYIAPSQEELFAHYASIAESTTLPVIPYNNPNRTGGVRLTPDTVARLAAFDNLVGVKDSSGSLALTADYINQTPDSFAVFQGSDDLIYPSLVLGAVGSIAATGNVVPELIVELYEAFVADDWERARVAQVKLASLRRATSWATYPAVLRSALTLLGEPIGPPRRPITALDESRLDPLRDVLVGMGLQPQM